jgi:hypothetical protein
MYGLDISSTKSCVLSFKHQHSYSLPKKGGGNSSLLNSTVIARLRWPENFHVVIIIDQIRFFNLNWKEEAVFQW